jgi:hypothetical protein
MTRCSRPTRSRIDRLFARHNLFAAPLRSSTSVADDAITNGAADGGRQDSMKTSGRPCLRSRVPEPRDGVSRHESVFVDPTNPLFYLVLEFFGPVDGIVVNSVAGVHCSKRDKLDKIARSMRSAGLALF